MSAKHRILMTALGVTAVLVVGAGASLDALAATRVRAENVIRRHW
jgi:hypothetical protein